MATYEFVCNECEKAFEVFVPGFLKEQDKRCPQCASTDVRQKFSSFLRNFTCEPSGRSGFG